MSAFSNISVSSMITTLGISFILFYSIMKILDFFGIGIKVYGSYIAFYFFLLISSFILPRYYTKINITRK